MFEQEHVRGVAVMPNDRIEGERLNHASIIFLFYRRKKSIG